MVVHYCYPSCAECQNLWGCNWLLVWVLLRKWIWLFLWLSILSVGIIQWGYTLSLGLDQISWHECGARVHLDSPQHLFYLIYHLVVVSLDIFAISFWYPCDVFVYEYPRSWICLVRHVNQYKGFVVSSNTELRQTVEVDVVLGYSKLHCGTLNLYLWVPLLLWHGWFAWHGLPSVGSYYIRMLPRPVFLDPSTTSVRVEICHDELCF